MSSQKVYEIITNRIISKLKSGVIPWHRPWMVSNKRPESLISHKPYRGINMLFTWLEGHLSPYWLTFKQAQALNGHVKKGEEGTPIIFWNWFKKIEKDPNSEEEFEKSIPFLRYYTVFNTEQCELPEGIVPAFIDKPLLDFNPISECERIVAQMPNKPEIKHQQARAFYSSTSDYVNLPKPETFDNAEKYYSTLFHELTHSTGHESRLGRHKKDHNHSFGSPDYSKEELVAEIGATFLCAFAGIENKTIDNSTAYVQSWLDQLKNDKKLVIIAAAQAQKATDFITNSI